MSGFNARSRAWPAAAALAACFAGASGPVWAGDGSGTDNPALLRGTIGLVCANGAACAQPQRGWPAYSVSETLTPPAITPSVAPVARPGNCASLNAAGIASAECAGSRQTMPAELPTPRAAPSPPVAIQPVRPAIDSVPTGAIIGPETPGDDAITGDWRLALRGSSTWDNRGQRYEIIVGPQGELTLHRARGEARLSAGVDLAYEPGGPASVAGGSGAIEIDHALAQDLLIKAAFRIDGSRKKINAVTSPSNEEQGALSILGSADVEIEKQAGRTSFVLGGALSRQYVGDTILVGGVSSSNADSNWTGFGFRARAGYQLTPILSTYLEAKADRAYYDAVASGSGARQDNWTYQFTAGLSGKWSNGVEASLYGGYGLTQYDSSLLTSGGGYVVGGNFAYPVGRRGQLTASLDTNFKPTDTVPGASTKIGYAATLGGRYLVNDWVTLRGALGGSLSVYPGATYYEAEASANAGLDWALGPHTAVNADYTLGATWTPSANGLSHTVGVGLTVSR